MGMAARAPASRVALATSFITAARRYWLDVFPRTRSEGRHWKHHAQRIPDPTLRRHALEAQQVKSGNIEGSTAFAAFASREKRTAVIRAQVAFQSAYDYLDTLAEQPSVEPVLNARQLHQALVAASGAASPHVDYYAHNSQCDDGGYLAALVHECRAALTALPSYASVALPIQRLTQRIVAYQSLNLSDRQGGQGMLAEWARCETPTETGLAWWETAAAAGSSLGVFALMTAAARPTLGSDEALAIEQAYWPWIGALHSLLDSLVDLSQDAAAGQRSLLDYYESPQEAAGRLHALVEHALNSVSHLPRAQEHATVILGMIGFYLAGYEPCSMTGRLAASRVLEALGAMGKPCILTFRVRRALQLVSLSG